MNRSPGRESQASGCLHPLPGQHPAITRERFQKRRFFRVRRPLSRVGRYTPFRCSSGVEVVPVDDPSRGFRQGHFFTSALEKNPLVNLTRSGSRGSDLIIDEKLKISRFRKKLKRYRIHAVAEIFWRHPLSLENVAQMRSAIIASYLCPHAVSVECSLYRSLYLIIKTRPSAFGVKFVFRAIELRVTSFANIDPNFIKILILSRIRCLGPLLLDNLFFFFG